MSKKKGTTKSLAPVVAAMAIAASTGNADDKAMESLLNSINPEGGVQPVVETIEHDGPTDGDIHAAVAGLEAQEQYAGQPSEAEVKEKEKAEAKAKADADKATAKAQKAADREAAKAAKAAAKAAEPPKVPRVKYENKTDLMKARLGADLGNYMVLETSDAALEGDALKAKQDETLELIDGMSQKVKNRANFLMTFMHSGGKLNEVVERAFRVLKTEGNITTGDKGNFHLNLIGRPYSVAAARAMGNNTVAMLKHLKVLVGEKGTYTPNPDSLILAKVNGQLGL